MKNLTKTLLLAMLVLGLTSSSLFGGNVRIDREFMKMIDNASKNHSLKKLSTKIEGKSAFGIKYTSYVTDIFDDIEDRRNKNNSYQNENSGIISLAPDSELNANYGYQCVGLVKAVSKKNMGSTRVWKKGKNVKDRKPYRGHVIATFGSNGKYDYRHVAIVLKAFNDHIVVIDQNWAGDGNNPVGQIYIHSIDYKGTGVANAGNYYIVRYP